MRSQETSSAGHYGNRLAWWHAERVWRFSKLSSGFGSRKAEGGGQELETFGRAVSRVRISKAVLKHRTQDASRDLSAQRVSRQCVECGASVAFERLSTN